tara:strand:- start:712 stop:909 length:198 start_codon:yes stop_codon:yes gene_type:complete
MVSDLTMLEAEMENLLANVAEDRKQTILDLVDIRERILDSLKLVDTVLKEFGVDPNEKTTNKEEW